MALCALGLCLSQTGTQITQDDNTRKQPLSDASVKIDGSTSWRSAVDSVVFDWSQVCLNWLVLLVLVTANLTCKCKTQSLAMMKKYLRWKAEWLYGIPHGSINWALVPACPSKIGKDLACPACWCVFLLCFWSVFELLEAAVMCGWVSGALVGQAPLMTTHESNHAETNSVDLNGSITW